MSTALAIAGVSALLRDLLNDGLINHNVAGVAGNSVTVSVGPPDHIVVGSGSEVTQLNLFLHQVTPNLGWRNEGLPARDPSGRQRLSNPPLALDLHYLISAYGGGELHGEILLGYAMQLLHETPVLTRDAIRTALNPSPAVGEVLPPVLRALADAGLDTQIEQLRINPEYLSTEEMSKLWTATQAHYRPTVAYQISVVVIESTEPLHVPLPVLTRGRPAPDAQRDPGVLAALGAIPPVPMIEAVRPFSGESAARPGETIELVGHHLSGTDHSVRLINDRLAVERSLPATADLDGQGQIGLQCAIPNPPDPVTDPDLDFPVGIYRIDVHFWPPGETNPRVTNQLALTIAPSITELPQDSVHLDSEGKANFTIEVAPAVRSGQSALLILGQHAYPPEPFTGAVVELHFAIPDAPLDNHLVRLRIDGIDSPIVNRTTTSPTFMDQRIEITP